MTYKLLIYLLFVFGVPANTKRVSLSCQQIKQIVDMHNMHRQDAAFGHIPGQPAASDMNALAWDEELAEKAADWAENGSLGYNPDRTVPSKRWEEVGENIYYSSIFSPYGPVMPNLDEAMNNWYSEFMYYNFEPYSLEISEAAGHYTQMMWAGSTKVGCGLSQKKKNGYVTTFYVCDYGPSGNSIGQTPYTASSSRGSLHCGSEDCERSYGVDCSV